MNMSIYLNLIVAYIQKQSLHVMYLIRYYVRTRLFLQYGLACMENMIKANSGYTIRVYLYIYIYIYIYIHTSYKSIDESVVVYGL